MGGLGLRLLVWAASGIVIGAVMSWIGERLP